MHAGRLVTLVWVAKLARALRERRQIVPVGVSHASRAKSFILEAPVAFSVFSTLRVHVTYCTLNNTGVKNYTPHPLPKKTNYVGFARTHWSNNTKWWVWGCSACVSVVNHLKLETPLPRFPRLGPYLGPKLSVDHKKNIQQCA